MWKKLISAAVILLANAGIAFAQVEINNADQASLESITGVGPAMSKMILEERKRGGSFRNWDDLEQRVKGIGQASAKRLSQAGLTVNGQPWPDAATKPAVSPAGGTAPARK